MPWGHEALSKETPLLGEEKGLASLSRGALGRAVLFPVAGGGAEGSVCEQLSHWRLSLLSVCPVLVLTDRKQGAGLERERERGTVAGAVWGRQQ